MERWKTKQTEGWVKLNTDGSCRDNGRAGFSYIMSSAVNCFARNIGVCCAYMVKLWGVYEGLRYA